MKLALIQDRLRGGGTEAQTLFFAKNMGTYGIEVKVFIFRPGGAFFSQLQVSGIPFKVLQAKDLRLDFLAPGLISSLRKYQPDQILCMGNVANAYAGWIKKRLGVLTIGSIRSGRRLSLFQRLSLGVLDGLIVNSEWARNRVPSFKRKIAVIPNALHRNWNREAAVQSGQSLRKKYQISKDTCIFLNVSGFRPQKRQFKAIHLIAQLPDFLQQQIQVWFVGAGKCLQACKQKVRVLGLENCIRFFPFDPDPFDYFAAADVAFSTSCSESLPNFLVEAQHMGLPIVAFPAGGIQECFLHEETGFLIHSDEAFLEKWKFYIENPEHREVMKRSAFKWADQNFQPSKCLERFSRFLSLSFLT